MLGWLLLIFLIGICFRKHIMNFFGRGHPQPHRQIMEQQQANYQAIQVQPIQPVYVYHQPYQQPYPHNTHQPQPPTPLQVNIRQPSVNDEIRA